MCVKYGSKPAALTPYLTEFDPYLTDAAAPTRIDHCWQCLLSTDAECYWVRKGESGSFRCDRTRSQTQAHTQATLTPIILGSHTDAYRDRKKVQKQAHTDRRHSTQGQTKVQTQADKRMDVSQQIVDTGAYTSYCFLLFEGIILTHTRTDTGADTSA